MPKLIYLMQRRYAKAYLNIFIKKKVKGWGEYVVLHVHPDENVLHNVSGKVL